MIRPTFESVGATAKAPRPLLAAGLVVLGGWLSACAPTLPSLIAERHYGEAICAANEATTYDIDKDQLHRDTAEGVAQAMVTDLAPRVHLHALTHSELETLVGPKTAAAIATDYVIVRAVLDTDRIPFAEFSFGPLLTVEGEQVSAQPWKRSHIVSLTGEMLPEARTVEPGAVAKAIHDVESALHGAREIGTLLLDVPTLGIFSKFFPLGAAPREPTAEVVRPTEKEIVCAAPLAVALERALASDWLCEPGRSCTDWTAWPRAGTAGGALSFHFSFEQQAVSGRGDCTTWTEVPFALPPGRSLQERIAAAFPNTTMHPLATARPEPP